MTLGCEVFRRSFCYPSIDVNRVQNLVVRGLRRSEFLAGGHAPGKYSSVCLFHLGICHESMVSGHGVVSSLGSGSSYELERSRLSASDVEGKENCRLEKYPAEVYVWNRDLETPRRTRSDILDNTNFSRHMPDVRPVLLAWKLRLCGNGMDTAGSGNSRLVHLTFLRTDFVRSVNMRTEPLCSICPVSHKTLLQRLQRTTRYTSFRVRPLHFLQR